MNSREKVLSVYPNMDVVQRKEYEWVAYDDSTKITRAKPIGCGTTEQGAIDDAASKLPSAPSPAGSSEPHYWQNDDGGKRCGNCGTSQTAENKAGDCPAFATSPAGETASAVKFECPWLCGDAVPHTHIRSGPFAPKEYAAVPEPVSPEGAAEVEAKFDPAFLVLVPRAPTPKMMTAAWTNAMKGEVSGVWAAMIAAWDAQTQEAVDLYERLQSTPEVAAPIAPAAVSETELLAEAIVDIAIAAGITKGELPRTGPEVLTLAKEVKHFLTKPSAEGDGWIAVTEGLPEVRDYVLAVDSRDGDVGIFLYVRRGFVRSPGGCVEKVTHWRPLPAPPSGQGEKR